MKHKKDMELAVVTGGGSGIGRAVALNLSEEPVSALAIGRREKPLEETAALAPGVVLPLSADISSAEGRERIIETVRKNAPIRYLVHSAGIFSVDPLTDVSEDVWRSIIGANLEGPLFLTRELIPYFAKEARVLFIGSRSATRARKGAGAYCVSKAASDMLRRCLTLELAERNILVSSAIPGSVNTRVLDISVKADPDIFPDGLTYRREKKEGKLIEPETVGRFVRRLLARTSDKEFISKEWELEDEACARLRRDSSLA